MTMSQSMCLTNSQAVRYSEQKKCAISHPRLNEWIFIREYSKSGQVPMSVDCKSIHNRDATRQFQYLPFTQSPNSRVATASEVSDSVAGLVPSIVTGGHVPIV